MCAIKKLRSCSHVAKSYSCFLKKIQEVDEELRDASSRRKCNFVFIQMVLCLFSSFEFVFCVSVFRLFRLSFQEINK